jgi:hypothetical protein
VKNTLKLQALGALVLLSAGWLAGCKSAPPLTQDQAKALIQAKYDQAPATPFNISVDDRGMQQGARAKFWVGTKRYPNGYWGDFAITPDGKKIIKLPGGGDAIQWRPESPNDPKYAVVVVPVVPVHLKARDVAEPQDVGSTKVASFMEDVNLEGLPVDLQTIAHSPGNNLSTRRQATFELTNGAWTLRSID